MVLMKYTTYQNNPYIRNTKTRQGRLPPKPQTGNPKGKYKKVKGIL